MNKTARKIVKKKADANTEVLPQKKHGVTLIDITRRGNPRFLQEFGNRRGILPGGTLFAVGCITTDGFNGDFEFQLLPDEIAIVTQLEEMVAKRLSGETLRKGKSVEV